jgi:hypothetical protein
MVPLWTTPGFSASSFAALVFIADFAFSAKW